MASHEFMLISKKQLTSDVFEIVYETSQNLDFIAGQFITFLLPKTKFARAYSVLKKEKNKYYFLIKRLENGRGGSKEICDRYIGTSLIGLGPTGHFVQNNEGGGKIFFATGTGIVPLYAMILDLLEHGYNKPLKLVWGQRIFADVYYYQEIIQIGKKYQNFEVDFYLSREEKEGFKFGYVGNSIESLDKNVFQEAYICGNPNMVDEVKLLLGNHGFDMKKIFTEKY